MKATVIAAIIAAFVSLVLGVANILLTIHKNKQDSIAFYRMQWIDNVREEFSKILSWTWYMQDSDGKIRVNSINPLRQSVYKVCLFLNVKDVYDHKVIEKTFEYLDEVTNVYEKLNLVRNVDNGILQYAIVQDTQSKFNNSEKIKKELLRLIRIYLKTEWTRVKLESSINKFEFLFCWRPFIGFKADKAIEKFSEEYKNL